MEIKRNRPDWSQILGQMAPGLSQGIGAQSAIQAQLLPLLFKAHLETQGKLAELALKKQHADEFLGRAERSGRPVKVKYNEYGMPESVEYKSPKEQLEDLEAQELLGGVSSVQPVIAGMPTGDGLPPGMSGIAGRRLAQKAAEQKMMAEVKAMVPTIQQKNDLQTAKQQLLNITTLEKKAENLPSGYYGITSIAGGAISRGGKTREYMKMLPATAVSVYRAITGDTRLSDADAAARAYPLLWHPSEGGDIRKSSFSNIKNLLNARIKMIQQGKYKMSGDQFITPLEDVQAETGSDVNIGIPQIGKIEDGYKFKGGDPSNPNSWEKL